MGAVRPRVCYDINYVMFLLFFQEILTNKCHGSCTELSAGTPVSCTYPHVSSALYAKNQGNMQKFVHITHFLLTLSPGVI